jgi:predicted glycosyltransferase
MNVLFEINHPAHFHLFKHPINKLIALGHNPIILSKSNSPLPELIATQPTWLVFYHGKKGRSILEKIIKQFYFNFLALRIIMRYQISLCVGVSLTMPQTAFLMNKKSLVLDDDDIKTTPVFAALSHTLATKVISPDCLQTNDNRKKYNYYPGLHELSYLHPSVFSPRKEVLSDLNLSQNEKLIILRFNAFKAHHDKGENGLSKQQRANLVSLLFKAGRVIISSENELETDLSVYKQTISPEKIHDLMAFADLYVGESQTMASEAAVLGIPAVRINTFKNRIAYLSELENKYGLLYSFTPDEFDLALKKIKELLMPETKQFWAGKRQKLLEDKINVSDFITKEILKFDN